MFFVLLFTFTVRACIHAHAKVVVIERSSINEGKNNR